MKQVILTPTDLGHKTVTMVSQSQLANRLGLTVEQPTPNTLIPEAAEKPTFTKPEDQKVAQLAYQAIKRLEGHPTTVPSVSFLSKPEIQAAILKEVTTQYRPVQLEMEAIIEKPDIAAIVAATAAMIIQQTIDIPRITVVPTGKVQSGFKPFTLKLDTLNYPPVSDELWAKHLRTDQVDVIAMGKAGADEARLEDYVVAGLVDFDDISYDAHADLLYDLAGQVVRHLQSYLKEEGEVRKVLRCYQRDIAKFIHAQMQAHYWEEATDYEVKINKGFTELKPSAYTTEAREPVQDFRQSPADKSNMPRYLFGGFKKCLYPVQKFQSDPERKMAVILDRESDKWFRPAKGQFQIYYKSGTDQPEYQPDFVAETPDVIYMVEPKRKDEMQDPEVLAKQEVAETYCQNATNHAKTYGGKRWQYLLIPHDAIADNMTLDGLAALYAPKVTKGKRP
jgi:type III restriction enzyme